MYSRWPEVAFCQNATSEAIIQFLEQLFCREGIPLELVSDNGSAFRSTQLHKFLDELGVRQVFSSPYSPQSCGMVERLNRTIKEAIQSARLAREPRAGFLRRFLAEYRTTVHPATGETPFLLMRGGSLGRSLMLLLLLRRKSGSTTSDIRQPTRPATTGQPPLTHNGILVTGFG